MSWVNGAPTAFIPSTDRGLQYGDGVFETIAVVGQKPAFWAEHWQRLANGCQRLRIPAPDHQTVAREALRLCQTAPASAVLKIIVTRGSGGRGYRPPEHPSPTRLLSLHPHPAYPDGCRLDGIHARFCQTRLGLNPALAGIKHLNRLEQVIARSEWHDPSVHEGIMLGADGYVREGTMSNVFYAKDARLYTPDLSQAGVAGIIRGLLLSGGHGVKVSVADRVDQRHLRQADELFVCNSIIGIWPVSRLDGQAFPTGPITRHLQAWLTGLQHESLQAP